MDSEISSHQLQLHVAYSKSIWKPASSSGIMTLNDQEFTFTDTNGQTIVNLPLSTVTKGTTIATRAGAYLTLATADQKYRFFPISRFEIPRANRASDTYRLTTWLNLLKANGVKTVNYQLFSQILSVIFIILVIGSIVWINLTKPK